MIMSFLEAFHAKESGTISWDEYVHNLLTRCGSVKHDEDKATLREIDSFGYSILLWCDKLEGIQDTSSLEAVFFLAYRHGTPEDVKTKAALLNGASAEGVNDSLALLALQERRADILAFCLGSMGGRRFPLTVLFVFRTEADSVDAEKDPETFKVLQESQFRKQVSSAGSPYRSVARMLAPHLTPTRVLTSEANFRSTGDHIT